MLKFATNKRSKSDQLQLLLLVLIILINVTSIETIDAAKILNNTIHSSLDCSGTVFQAQYHLADRCVDIGQDSSFYINCSSPANGIQQSLFNNGNCEGDPQTKVTLQQECRVVGERFSTKNQCATVADDKIVRMVQGTGCDHLSIINPASEMAFIRNECSSCFFGKSCIVSTTIGNNRSSHHLNIFEESDSKCKGNASATILFENGTCKSVRVPGEGSDRFIQLKPLHDGASGGDSDMDGGSTGGTYYDLTLSIIIRLRARLGGY